MSFVPRARAPLPLPGPTRVAIAIVAAGAVLLSWPAILNGFPLLFPDSAAYIRPSLRNPFRSPFYGVLTFLTHLRLSPWTIPFFQGAWATFVIWLIARTAGFPRLPDWTGRRGVSANLLVLGAVGVVALLTSLPWLTSQVMPDVHTGLLILLAWLVVSDGGLVRGRLATVGFVAAMAATITFHLSHLPIAAGLIGLATALAPFRLSGGPDWRGVARGLVALVLALAALVAANAAIRHRMVVSDTGFIFMLAAQVADGPGLAYLDAECPKAALAANVFCREHDRMPRDADLFLWSEKGVVADHDPAAINADARAITLGVWHAHPAEAAAQVLRGFARQLGRFATAEDTRPLLDRPYVEESVAVFGESARNAYRTSRQSTGRLPLAEMATLDGLATIMALVVVGLSMLPLSRAEGGDGFSAFVLFVLLGMAGNALVTGGLSGVFDRYQARVAWLPVLLAFFCVARLRFSGPLRRQAAAREARR